MVVPIGKIWHMTLASQKSVLSVSNWSFGRIRSWLPVLEIPWDGEAAHYCGEMDPRDRDYKIFPDNISRISPHHGSCPSSFLLLQINTIHHAHTQDPCCRRKRIYWLVPNCIILAPMQPFRPGSAVCKAALARGMQVTSVRYKFNL